MSLLTALSHTNDQALTGSADVKSGEARSALVFNNKILVP
jgi:hypothetical protein